MKFREHGVSFLLGMVCAAVIIFATHLHLSDRVEPDKSLPAERTLTETLRLNDAAINLIASNNVRLKGIAQQLREDGAWMKALNENLRTNR